MLNVFDTTGGLIEEVFPVAADERENTTLGPQTSYNRLVVGLSVYVDTAVDVNIRLALNQNGFGSAVDMGSRILNDETHSFIQGFQDIFWVPPQSKFTVYAYNQGSSDCTVYVRYALLEMMGGQ